VSTFLGFFDTSWRHVDGVDIIQARFDPTSRHGRFLDPGQPEIAMSTILGFGHNRN